MAYENYAALRIRVGNGIARATIDHPPINLLDLVLIIELDRFSREVEADTAVRVVVVDSADPDFFAAHADVGLIQALPVDDTAPHTELSAIARAKTAVDAALPDPTPGLLGGQTREVERQALPLQ